MESSQEQLTSSQSRSRPSKPCTPIETFITSQHVQSGPSADLHHNNGQAPQPALPSFELNQEAGQLAHDAANSRLPNGDLSALGTLTTSYADVDAQNWPMQPARDSEHHSMQNGSGGVASQPVYGPMPAPANYPQQHHQVQCAASHCCSAVVPESVLRPLSQPVEKQKSSTSHKWAFKSMSSLEMVI